MPECVDQSKDDDLAQPEERQDSGDDDDHADDVDDGVHGITFFAWVKGSNRVLAAIQGIISFRSGKRCALAHVTWADEMARAV
jgi:hypothetical protein